MFDLEQALAEWRQQMLITGIQSPVPLEELESHLREEIEQQMRSGMAVQPAFELAVQRMGHAGMLQNEFKKASLSGQRLRPQYFHIYCYVVPPAMLLVDLGMRMMNEISWIELAGGILLALYAGSLPRWHRRLANPRNRLVQAVLLIGGFFALTWPIWAILDLLPSGIAGNMIASSILPAWSALGLAYMVYGRTIEVDQPGSTAGSKKRQYV